jgi:hypothetical protein
VLALSKNLLAILGIRTADIEKKADTSEPQFHILNSETSYFVNHVEITNIQQRGVGFRRSVDGVAFLGAGQVVTGTSGSETTA